MIEKGRTKEDAWVKYCSSRINSLNIDKSCVDRRDGMTLLGRWLRKGSRNFLFGIKAILHRWCMRTVWAKHCIRTRGRLDIVRISVRSILSMCN